MSQIRLNIETVLARHRITGADVAIIQNDSLLHFNLCSPPEGGETEKLYPVYSITKTMIAAGIVKLCASGRLELDRRLKDYLPQLEKRTEATLRETLSHTGGIPDYGPLPEYLKSIVENPRKPWSAEEYIERTFSLNRIECPAGRFYYSNLGYGLLKLLLETIYGQDLGVILEKEIFQPLGMGHSRVLNNAEDLLQCVPAQTYSVIPGGDPVDVRDHYHPGWVAHGLAASTAPEIAGFYAALMAGRVVSPPYLDEMLKSRPLNTPHPWFQQAGYGLGMMSAETGEGRIYGHSGGGPGYMAAGYHLTGPAPLTVAVLTTNEMAFSLEKAILEIIDLVSRT